MWEAISRWQFKATLAVVSLFLAITAIGLDETHADDDDLRGLFGQRAHFTAKLTNEATVPLVPDRGFSGKAKAWLILDNGELKVRYRLETDMDLNAGFPQTLDDGDDVTQIHLHDAPPGVAGPHVLNVYKAPAQDDDDLNIMPNQGVVKGLWDDGDLSEGLPPGPASVPLTDALEALCAGNVYANVHGTGDQGTGALRGNLEPTRRGERACRALESLDEDGDD